MENQQSKYERFRSLHLQEKAFVMPNPWDAGSTRLLTAMGFEALATTSAGYAFSVGKRDSFAGLEREEILRNAQAIVEATDLPVSADLEDGFGVLPEACAETVRAACEVGLVGGSIEDATGYAEDPIYDLGHSVKRVTAAVEAIRGRPFFLTARAENFINGRPDLGDTIKRLQAYAEVGADVLYAPGLPDLEAIRTLCAELDKPVNVVMGLTGPTWSVEELSDAGVSRISVGGSFARSAFGALRRAAQEVLSEGTFTYAKAAMSGADLTAMMVEDKVTDRS